MIDYLELSVFLASVFVITMLILDGIRLRLKNKRHLNDLAKSNIEKATLESLSKKLIEEKQSEEVEKTDGFVKFLSESRDWAFSYIEQVQKAIIDLALVMDKIIEDPELSNDEAIAKELAIAYNNLIELLPKEEKAS